TAQVLEIDRYRRRGRTERDWLAGVGGLELRNVIAKYPFERPHRFPGIQPNSGQRDHSRLNCGVWEKGTEQVASVTSRYQRVEMEAEIFRQPLEASQLAKGGVRSIRAGLLGHPRHIRQEKPIDVERLIAHVASQNVDDLGNFLL